VAAPTVAPLSAAASTTQSSGGGINSFTALAIAVIGVGLVAGGYLLRRRSQLSR
jgi:hypothetical protein